MGALGAYLLSELESVRLPLLDGRLDWCKRSRKLGFLALAFRDYLRLEDLSARKALTRSE